MNRKKILIVEDDVELNKGLNKALKLEDRYLFSCTNIIDAREQLAIQSINLVLLDINLPDGNGLDLLREIKNKYPKTMVILLSANDTDIDVVKGLEEGADDYITKPFSLSVLRARVNTQLKKHEEGNEETAVRIDHFFFDFLNQEFKVFDLNIELSKTEQKLLHCFVLNRGNILSRNQLINNVWDSADYIDENALSVAVKRLRDKLNTSDYIQTVYGIGYRWVNK